MFFQRGWCKGARTNLARHKLNILRAWINDIVWITYNCSWGINERKGKMLSQKNKTNETIAKMEWKTRSSVIPKNNGMKRKTQKQKEKWIDLNCQSAFCQDDFWIRWNRDSLFEWRALYEIRVELWYFQLVICYVHNTILPFESQSPFLSLTVWLSRISAIVKIECGRNISIIPSNQKKTTDLGQFTTSSHFFWLWTLTGHEFLCS